MGRILVVDDSIFARLKICGMLREAGYETVEAANGREGLAMACALQPDCILSDLLMPEMDGTALSWSLRLCWTMLVYKAAPDRTVRDGH
jgi:CheY-like chemotaxis protein